MDVGFVNYVFYWGESDPKYDPSGSPAYHSYYSSLVYSPFWVGDTLLNGSAGPVIAGNGTSFVFNPRGTTVKIISGTALMPVTARITEAHYNHLCIFQTSVSGGVVDIITPAMSAPHVPPIWPAEQNYTTLLSYSLYGFADDSLVKSKSLVRVPKNASAITDDVTLFGLLMNPTYFPSVTLESEASINGWPDYSAGELEAFNLMLNSGEHVFLPGDAPFPGWLWFCPDGKYGTTNSVPGHIPTGSGGSQDIGAGSQDEGAGA
jgi:hypothetical protein